MKGIQARLKLKGGEIEEPDTYLGADFSNMTNIDGQECWDMYSDKYCMEEVTNMESVLGNRGLRLPPKCVTPLRFVYCPEMGVMR